MKSRFALALLMTAAVTTTAAERCRIQDQSGTFDGFWCLGSNQTGTIRCYADVVYDNGSTERIFGDACVDTHGDCWSRGSGATVPSCAR